MTCNCRIPCKAEQAIALSRAAVFKEATRSAGFTPEYRAALSAAGVDDKMVQAAARLYATPGVTAT